ncbi:hypothetical protein DASB73_017620 [Starmerella bacillaris]|uniref:Uncharacterized protein n=1 Tax=Starmerella bacillaris TaxID=1247836 RepID=A0AAV5RH24_STABA|nr:hypothetical protein DASB73_017620 [Starmerella bacillaris]
MSLTQAIISVAACSPFFARKSIPGVLNFTFSKFTLRNYLLNQLLFQSWNRALLAAYVVYNMRIVEKLFGSAKYKTILVKSVFKGLVYQAVLGYAFSLLGCSIPFTPGPLVLLGVMLACYIHMVPSVSYISFGQNLRVSNKWSTYMALFLLTDGVGDIVKLSCGAAALALN